MTFLNDSLFGLVPSVFRLVKLEFRNETNISVVKYSSQIQYVTFVKIGLIVLLPPSH